MTRMDPLELGYGHLSEAQVRTLMAADRIDWQLTDFQKAAQWFLGGVVAGVLFCVIVSAVS